MPLTIKARSGKVVDQIVFRGKRMYRLELQTKLSLLFKTFVNIIVRSIIAYSRTSDKVLVC